MAERCNGGCRRQQEETNLNQQCSSSAQKLLQQTSTPPAKKDEQSNRGEPIGTGFREERRRRPLNSSPGTAQLPLSTMGAAVEEAGLRRCIGLTSVCSCSYCSGQWAFLHGRPCLLAPAALAGEPPSTADLGIICHCTNSRCFPPAGVGLMPRPDPCATNLSDGSMAAYFPAL